MLWKEFLLNIKKSKILNKGGVIISWLMLEFEIASL
jgi:hypothetical protein